MKLPFILKVGGPAFMFRVLFMKVTISFWLVPKGEIGVQGVDRTQVIMMFNKNRRHVIIVAGYGKGSPAI